MSFLDPAAVLKIGNLAVRAKNIVQGAQSGSHRAKMRGNSVEFAEHKEYSPGDDVRHLDWKVLAKADRYSVKQFEQESVMNCTLVLDASASMNYAGGEVSKKTYACHLLAAFGYLLLQQRDRVGLSVFGNPDLERFVPARAHATHLQDILEVLEDIADNEQEGSESLQEGLQRIAERSHGRGMVIVASDFLGHDLERLGILRALRARGHDVLVFHILDPDEIELPFEGLHLLKSPESGEELLVDPRSIRSLYNQRVQQFIEEVRKQCLDGGIDYQLVSTRTPYEEVIIDALAARQGGARGSGR